MTSDENGPTRETGARRHAHIETTHADAETATRLARAVAPDNTPEMQTRVDGEHVVTTIARGTTGGLHSTVDDYVLNLQLAEQLTARDREPSTRQTPDRDDTSEPAPDRNGRNTGVPDGKKHNTTDT